MKRTVGGIYREDCVANFCIINPNVNRNIMVENDKFNMDTRTSKYSGARGRLGDGILAIFCNAYIVKLYNIW